MVNPQDDHITVVFFPRFQLATGKKSRFLYDLVRAGCQPALGRLPVIARCMDIVLLKVSVVVPKPFETGTTRPISCSVHPVSLFGTPCSIFLKWTLIHRYVFTKLISICFIITDCVCVCFFFFFFFHSLYTISHILQLYLISRYELLSY